MHRTRWSLLLSLPAVALTLTAGLARWVRPTWVQVLSDPLALVAVVVLVGSGAAALFALLRGIRGQLLPGPATMALALCPWLVGRVVLLLMVGLSPPPSAERLLLVPLLGALTSAALLATHSIVVSLSRSLPRRFLSLWTSLAVTLLVMLDVLHLGTELDTVYALVHVRGDPAALLEVSARALSTWKALGSVLLILVPCSIFAALLVSHLRRPLRLADRWSLLGSAALLLVVLILPGQSLRFAQRGLEQTTGVARLGWESLEDFRPAALSDAEAFVLPARVPSLVVTPTQLFPLGAAHARPLDLRVHRGEQERLDGLVQAMTGHGRTGPKGSRRPALFVLLDARVDASLLRRLAQSAGRAGATQLLLMGRSMRTPNPSLYRYLRRSDAVIAPLLVTLSAVALGLEPSQGPEVDRQRWWQAVIDETDTVMLRPPLADTEVGPLLAVAAASEPPSNAPQPTSPAPAVATPRQRFVDQRSSRPQRVRLILGGSCTAARLMEVAARLRSDSGFIPVLALAPS